MGSTEAELREGMKAMRSVNEKQEKRVRYLETKSTQQAIFYILFQAIIFLSISKPSSISCNLRWIPLSLSLLVAIIFGLTFTSSFSRWASSKFEHERNLLEENYLFYQMTLAQQNQLNPEGSREPKNLDILLKPDMVREYLRRCYMYVTALALIGYTGVMLQACRSIPCEVSGPSTNL